MTRQPRSVLQNSLTALLLGLFGYSCKLIYTSILTHNVSLAHYGDFAVAWESLFLVSQLLTFGSGISAQRFFSRYVKEGEEVEKRSFINWIASMFLQSTAMLVVVYVVFWTVAYATKVPNSSLFDHYHLAALVVIFAPALSLLSLATSLVMAYGYTMLASFISTAVLRGGQLLAILLFISATSIDSLTHLVHLMFAVVLVPAITSITILLSLPNNEIIKYLISESSIQYQDGNWLKAARTAGLSQIMFRLTCTIDLFVLEIFSPEDDHVGLYSICKVCVALLAVVINTINQQMMVALMNTKRENRKEIRVIQNQLDKYNSIKLIIFLACIAVSTIFCVEILAFFHVHTSKFTILLPLMLLNVYLGDNRYQFGYLISQSDTGFLNMVRIGEVILLIVLAIVLVFPYDIYGVVLANTITLVLYKIVISYRCRQTTSLRLNLLISFFARLFGIK